MAADDRWAARAGWDLTAERVGKSPDGLDVPALLARIEAEMADAAPEVQWTMNATLAGIGIHFPKLRKRAIAVGEKLGVYRDHPVSKGCTSPVCADLDRLHGEPAGLSDLAGVGRSPFPPRIHIGSLARWDKAPQHRVRRTPEASEPERTERNSPKCRPEEAS
jgi:hypothetical protein